MNDNELKEVMKQYVEDQADRIMSETEAKQNLSSLDEKVYATINRSQDGKKTSAVWSYRKIATIAASFLLIIGLSMTAIWMLGKEPVHIVQDVCYSIIISYENEQYGYYSNRVVIDKYGMEDFSDLKQNPDSFTGSLTDTDIIQLDSVIDKESIIGAKIYHYSDEVIILLSNGQYYCFEKIVTK